MISPILPNFVSIHLIISVATFLPTCKILLSLICHVIVHYLTLIILLATYSLYGFDARPMPFNVEENKLYHSKADFTHPYKVYNNLKYNTLLPFSIHTNVSQFLFTSHIISIDSPSNIMSVQSSMFMCRYGPATSATTSAMATSLFSNASIKIIDNSVSFDIVGDICQPSYKTLSGHFHL